MTEPSDADFAAVDEFWADGDFTGFTSEDRREFAKWRATAREEGRRDERRAELCRAMTDEDAKRLAELREGLDEDSYADWDEMKFLLRLLDEALAERQWQPIETAPENIPVLVYCTHCAGAQIAVCWRKGAVWCGGPAEVPQFFPKHWRPTPESPK